MAGKRRKPEECGKERDCRTCGGRHRAESGIWPVGSLYSHFYTDVFGITAGAAGLIMMFTTYLGCCQ